MPVTLAQAKLNATDDIDVQIIDEFQKSSWLLNALTFDDVVSGAGNGATLTYGYTRQITERGAAFRAINAEYTPTEVTKQRYTVDLKPLGGSFQIDRVLNNVARGSETAFQLRELIKGTRAKAADAIINGDSTWDTNGFDGLNQLLKGTSTEFLPADNGYADEYIDLTAVDSQTEAFGVIGVIEEWLSSLDGRATAILGNRRALAKVKQIALYGGFYSGIPTGFGGQLDAYNGIPLIDLGEVAGSSTEVIPVESRDLDNTVLTVTVTGTPSGGTYTLTVTVNGVAATTGTIAHNAASATVQTAIRALSNVGSDGVTVSGSAGGPYTVTFVGELADEVGSIALGTNSLTGGTAPSVTIEAGAGDAAITGLTDLYAVRFGLDGFHAVSMAGQPLVKTWLPDFTTAGAVKTGEVELGPMAVVLKRTKAASVLRHVKVS